MKKTFNKKQNYLPYNIINKISDHFNNSILLHKEWSETSLKIEIFDLWEKNKGLMSNICYPKPIKEAEEALLLALKSPKDKLFDNVNNVLDANRRTSDVAFSKTKRDLLFLWNNIAYSEKRNWDIPWLRQTKVGEKFANFEKDESRYIFKGYANQMILLYSNFHKDKESIVLFKKELEDLLIHDFVEDKENKLPLEKQKSIFAMSKLKGISSLTSLFVPSQATTWLNEDGTKWITKTDKKYPTKEEIEKEKLKKASIMSFSSQPVWSVEDVAHLMSIEVQEKINNLRKIRSPKNDYELKEEHIDLDIYVDELINKRIKEQAIEVTERGSSAFYIPIQDTISIPLKSDFKNPIVRFATFSHELAHSTKHINERVASTEFGSVSYAKEELVAESTAHLCVKDLYDDLKKIREDKKLPEEWEKYFDDYFENATQYGKSWGSKFKFSELFETLVLEDSKSHNIFDKLMDETFGAYQLIKSPLIDNNEITPDIRKTFKEKSFLSLKNKNKNKNTIG